MNSTDKIVNLFLFFLITLFFIAPISAESLPDDETSILNDEGTFNNEELLLGEEPLIDKDINNSLSIDEDDSFVFEAPTLVFEVPVFETRSFDDIFPNFSQSQKRDVMSNVGLRSAFEKDEPPTLIPAHDSGIDLYSKVMLKKPSHIIEALVVVPYNKRELDMLDIYNAMRNIKDIQNNTVFYKGNEYKIFTNTTRLESAQNRKPISDPPPFNMLPLSETLYLCFVDRNIGDLYLRGDISISLFGITYSLTNFRDVSYSIFKVMKAEKFTAIIYVEPIKEGVLIYSMSGIYLPSFVANRINLSSNINYRINVLINWITDGLRREENISKIPHFYKIQKE